MAGLEYTPALEKCPFSGKPSEECPNFDDPMFDELTDEQFTLHILWHVFELERLGVLGEDGRGGLIVKGETE
jgi:hypothetical protein